MIKRILIGWFLMCIATYVDAEMVGVAGKVTKVQIMGQNYDPYSTEGAAVTFIHMDALPVACGSPYRRVAITSDHPAYKEVVSAAFAAKMANSNVELFYLESCTLWNNNAWDFAIINLL